MIEQKCVICGKKFLRKKSQVILGGGNYCSNKCRFIGRKNGKNVLCSFCGKEVYRSSKELKRSKSGEYFCSKKCLFAQIYKKYEGHPNWTGGFHAEYRKKLIKYGKSGNSCLLCNENNFKILVAHHIDKDRSNNSIHNLVWLCHNCHFLVHHYREEEKQLARILHGKAM